MLIVHVYVSVQVRGRMGANKRRTRPVSLELRVCVEMNG